MGKEPRKASTLELLKANVDLFSLEECLKQKI